MTELERKIAEADKVELYYRPPHDTKWAIVEYCFRKGRPLKVGQYYIYGEELKTGKPLVCWYWMDSCNFTILEDGFNTEEEAKARLMVLKAERKRGNDTFHQ